MAIGQGAVDRTHRLDGHAVDLEHLVTQQVDEIVAGQADAQLVDDDTVLALEDVDGDDVTADRADPAGHRPECTRPIGQLHPDQVVGHRLRLGVHCVRAVSGQLRHPTT